MRRIAVVCLAAASLLALTGARAPDESPAHPAADAARTDGAVPKVTLEQFAAMTVEVREMPGAAERRRQQMEADRQRLNQRLSRPADLAAVHARLREIRDRKGISGTGYLVPLSEIDSVLQDKFANSTMAQDGADVAVSAIDDFSRVLKERGIGLVVVVAPPCAEVCANEFFPGVSREQTVWPEYTRFLIKLLETGVEVVDVLDAMKQYKGEMDLYCPADAHWGPGGIETAAWLVADRLFSRNRFVTQFKQPERFFSCSTTTIPSPISTVVRNMEILGREDDELLALSFPPLPIYQVRLLGKVCPRPRSRRSPVLVIGDSFGYNLYQQGGSFSQHLSRELGFLVNDVCVAGGLQDAPAQCIVEALPDAPETRFVVLITGSADLSRRRDKWKLASKAVAAVSGTSAGKAPSGENKERR